ncbi:MAG: SRPBCC family protein [Proteobacteria bacterium]|nr:SRPBCC family protein [Pseudomonadota bacterium]
MSDRIEKSIELKAPIARVWRALTDHHEFGEWFRVKLEGPFVVGEISRGRITYPGYEHLEWRAEIQAMESERLFSFTWHPGAGSPEFNYAEEPPTLVEFTVTPTDSGTLLVIVESGFSKLPESRRADSLRMNDQGWTDQIENIRSHVES